MLSSLLVVSFSPATLVSRLHGCVYEWNLRLEAIRQPIVPITDPIRMEDMPSSHFHAVRFYQDSDSLCRIVAGFIADGFEAGEPAVIIATPSHGKCIARLLFERSVDVNELQQ